MADEPFGMTVKLARVRLGLQQRDVAHRAKISRQALSRIEANVWLPKPSTRDRLCRVLNLDPGEAGAGPELAPAHALARR